MPKDAAPLPFADDPVLLVQVVARLAAERMMADQAKAGLADVRESDGFVFQHLLGEPVTITELAARLGITQQGASKAVADLERRGLVARRPAADDARSRVVVLTDRGHDAVRRGRATRRRLAATIERTLGAARAAAFRRDLARLADALGGFEALEGRRLRPPT